jgi:arginyl-tRNA synthetase
MLHLIEQGDSEDAELGHLVADAVVKTHLATMWRLNIVYDVLPRASEILHLQFWATAFELLKDRKAIYLETEGKNQGCWVMPGSAFREGSVDGDDDNKVIVRSNGTVTYVGKDRYQLWKFGRWAKTPPSRGIPIRTDMRCGLRRRMCRPWTRRILVAPRGCIT